MQIGSSKEQNLFEIEIFCNIINVFTHFWLKKSVPAEYYFL